ncbi:MAG: ATP-binding cassette domain-containing protein [Pirellulales bacterium]
MAGVVLENVSRVYPGDIAAVKGIDLEVFDREFLVLVGPSGCGKTTTLRLIAGLEELSDGKIVIGTRLVNDVPPKDRDIAMVFQNYALYPHLTVYRNLAFGLELREGVGGLGWLWRWALPPGRKNALADRRRAIAQRVRDAARMLGIEDLLQRYPRQLSGGERQRVALGRAMVRSPAVFLFDEPLSNLDAKLRVEMRRELKQLHQRLQTTMIYVTHDQVEALTLGQRIVVMNEGSIQQVGRPMEVYDWPANRFVAGFIGTPAMNFIGGELFEEQGARRFRRGQWSVPLDGRLSAERTPVAARQPALLGVRPEDVRVEPQLEGTKSSAPTARLGAIPAEVSLVEMLGDATIVTVRLDAAKPAATSGDGQTHSDEESFVIVKMEPRVDLQAGQLVDLHVDPDKLHAFDPLTGENWVRRPAV